MAEIVPAIIAKDFGDFKDKVDAVRGYTDWVQLDVVDGIFAENMSWGDPKELMIYDADAFIGAHLMVQNPELMIGAWADSPVRRIFFHYESTTVHDDIIRIAKEHETTVGFALKRDTSVDVLDEWGGSIDAVLLLGVDPGFYGSVFDEGTFAKIHTVRARFPELTIVVDGGMNPERAKRAAETGADFIAAGSYIFESDNPKRRLQELQNAVS